MKVDVHSMQRCTAQEASVLELPKTAVLGLSGEQWRLLCEATWLNIECWRAEDERLRSDEESQLKDRAPLTAFTQAQWDSIFGLEEEDGVPVRADSIASAEVNTIALEHITTSSA